METIQKPTYLQPEGISDGGELTPAEVAANRSLDDRHIDRHATDSLSAALKDTAGVTRDREGLTDIHGVETQPYVQSQPRFGWTRSAERLNGRLAMIGFVALVVTEWAMHKSLIGILLSLG